MSTSRPRTRAARLLREVARPGTRASRLVVEAALMAVLVVAGVPGAGLVAAAALVVAHEVADALLGRLRRPALPRAAATTGLLVALGLVLPPELLALVLLAGVGLVVRTLLLLGGRAAAVAEVALLVPLAVDAWATTSDPGTTALLLGHPLLTLAIARSVALLVDERDARRRALARLDDALAVVGAAGAGTPGGIERAVERGVQALLPGARLLELVVRDGTGPAPGEDAHVAAAIRDDAVVRARGADGTWRVAVPVHAGARVVGGVLVETRTEPSGRTAWLLDTFVDRLAVLLLAEESRARAAAAERAERRAREAVQRAERHRDDVLARLSHDLRVPVTTLEGTARTLAEHRDELSPAQVDRLFGSLVRNAERVAQWVDSLLDDATHGLAGELVPVPADAAELLATGAEVASGLLRDHRVLVVAPRARVLVDPLAVTRVLGNLLGNAVQHAPRGSLVELFAARRGDDALRIELRDRGPGVPDELRDRVFAAGVSGREDGAGLGLATVADLVGRMGGDVGVEETDGGGATFWFTLPLADDDGGVAGRPDEEPRVLRLDPLDGPDVARTGPASG